jgi:hypothetical protein
MRFVSSVDIFALKFTTNDGNETTIVAFVVLPKLVVGSVEVGAIVVPIAVVVFTVVLSISSMSVLVLVFMTARVTSVSMTVAFSSVEVEEVVAVDDVADVLVVTEDDVVCVVVVMFVSLLSFVSASASVVDDVATVVGISTAVIKYSEKYVTC